MPLKLCDRHYQMFPTSLFLERLPAKFREWEMLYAYFLKFPCSWCGHIAEYYPWAGGTLGSLLVSLSKGEDVRHLLFSLLPPSCPADRSDVWSLVVMFNHRETSMRTKNQQIKDGRVKRRDTLGSLIITLSSEPFLKLKKYIYIYIYIYTHTHTHIYIYTHTHTHTHIYIFMVEAIVSWVFHFLKLKNLLTNKTPLLHFPFLNVSALCSG